MLLDVLDSRALLMVISTMLHSIHPKDLHLLLVMYYLWRIQKIMQSEK